ncbi:MAG: prolyl oligopeptidase family serine peptidase [Oligoflexia bacterium]|nr:prolyl oligopeptidase family serine peptidase [Oligoflexia bacterium]
MIRFAIQVQIFILLTSMSANSSSLPTRLIDVSQKEMGLDSTSEVRAKLVVPNNQEVKGGLVLLHGSEGGGSGHTLAQAQLLAASGYAALVICYKSCDSSLVRFDQIEIEDTYKALDWFRNSKYLTSKKVALYGVSRGAELAMLLAAISANTPGLKPPDALATHAVTDRVVGGFFWYHWYHYENGDARKPLPPTQDPELHNPLMIELEQPWRWRGSTEGLSEDTRIPIERFKGPVLVTHGAKDPIWTVDKAKNIQKSLKKRGGTFEVHLFEGEGHRFRAQAENKRCEILLKFLSENLH